MTILYRFSSLADLAEYFERREEESRKSANKPHQLKSVRSKFVGECYAYSHVVNVLRNTVIEEPTPRRKESKP